MSQREEELANEWLILLFAYALFPESKIKNSRALHLNQMHFHMSFYVWFFKVKYMM